MTKVTCFLMEAVSLAMTVVTCRGLLGDLTCCEYGAYIACGVCGRESGSCAW